MLSILHKFLKKIHTTQKKKVKEVSEDEQKNVPPLPGYGHYGRCSFRHFILQGIEEENRHSAGWRICVGGADGEWLRMSANDETVYLKIEQNVLVSDRNVTIGDIASVTSANEAMVRQIRQKKLYAFRKPQDAGKRSKIQREVFSVLKVIELIHEDYPNAKIQNEGESDFIIEYRKDPAESSGLDFLKTAVLCLVVFFGGAFTIMSFNNDISITELFGKFYYQVMGIEESGVTELEITYCIGLAIGILVFFNHFGKHKITPDPTPIQVQLRKYEQDVDTTFIQNAGRGGKEIDVS